MAVHYAQNNDGLLGSLLGAAAMFVPGLQGVAPFIGAASALANGDPLGAITGIAAPTMDQNPLFDALTKVARGTGTAQASPWDYYQDWISWNRKRR